MNESDIEKVLRRLAASSVPEPRLMLVSSAAMDAMYPDIGYRRQIGRLAERNIKQGFGRVSAH